MFKLIELIMRNNQLLINILTNNFKPKDLRDVIEANTETITRFECDLDAQAQADVARYEADKSEMVDEYNPDNQL
jgi:hypothetical protein